ncbi:four helix bundle protein [Patescibacteria group bacterium]|nr:four helix bundle protein [Patescibacteria group bacterium]
MLNSYKELIVWQKSFKLIKKIYKVTENFPKSEIYGLSSQMRRASISIPSNIAEGFVRKHKKEFSQFVSIAFGSGAELETQLLLSKELKFITDEEFNEIDCLLQEVMKMLNSLKSKLTNLVANY